VKADQANLNAELGIYGHTEAVPTNLTAPIQTYAIANAIVRTTISRPASGTQAGARVSGTRVDLKAFCVGIVVGDSMATASLDIDNTNQQSAFCLFSRHQKGDTAYAIDSAVENMIYSVSNAGWVDTTSLGCQVVQPVITTLENINLQPGLGAPYTTWAEAK